MFYQNLSPDGTECYGPLTVTLIGYKVMEERSKFTLYKILVRRAPDETWVIYRRYTEFSQLNDKLKELFPWLNVGLPPKRWFKNFNAEFLEERQLALQTFLHNLVSHRHVTNSEAVKEFLCLNDPPAASDGSEESMPFTEKHEENSCGLQKELMDKKREIGPLRNTLEDRALQISKPGRTVNGTYMTQEELNGQAAVNHWIESNSDANGDFLREQEYNEVERDNLRRHNERSELQFIRSHGACWCGSAIDSPYTNIQTRAPEDNL